MRNLILSLVIISGSLTQAQDIQDVKYRRSSLHVMMMEDASLSPEYKNIVDNAFLSMPFPDKYDNHDIGIASHDILSISAPESEEVSKEEKKLKGVDKKIEKFFKDNGVAKSIIAKWFNRKDDGSMDLELIAERGKYDATTLDLSKAKMQSKSVKTQMLDAGKELIGNTFVVINKANFIENEIAATVVYTAANLVVEELPEKDSMQAKIKQIARDKAAKVYERTRKGYTVSTRAFLYKLSWNDSIYDIFMNEHAVTPDMDDELKQQKKLSFDNSDTYEMEYVGMEKAKIIVLNLTGEDLSTQQIISEATVRTTDKVYAKLQKNYEVFKPKTPLAQVENKGKICTAKIGLKEGLEGGEKFDVLEQFTNKDGLTEYKSIATIKVDKSNIWDNQYYAMKPPVIEGEKVIQATSFKGCKKSFYPGLLIKQRK